MSPAVRRGAEVRRALAASLLLARGRTEGMGLFDLSVEGFWRSFIAGVLIIPGYLLLVVDQYARAPLPAEPGTIAAVEALSYALGFVAFPLAAAGLTWFLGLGRRYVPLIVASNWATLPQVGLMLAALVVGVVLPPLRSVLFALAALATLVYQWFVVRTALETTTGTALAFVAADTVISLALNVMANALLGVGQGAGG